MHRSRFALIVMLSMVLFLVPCAWAQENATIVGTVVDASNAVVPNAEITLTNTATSQVRTATSNTSGIYLFANVGVGQFTLSAAAKGFQKYTKTDIVVNTAQTLKEDISLTVGSETQTVTVEADALTLQAETNEVSNLITGSAQAEPSSWFSNPAPITFMEDCGSSTETKPTTPIIISATSRASGG